MLNKTPKRDLANRLLSKNERTQAKKPYTIFDSKGWLKRKEEKRLKVLKRIKK